jgi:hypothetical protein
MSNRQKKIKAEMEKILKNQLPKDKVNMPERTRKKIAYETAKQRLRNRK